MDPPGGLKRSSSIEIIDEPNKRVKIEYKEKNIIVLDEDDEFDLNNNMKLLKDIFPDISQDQILEELKKNGKDPDRLNATMDDLLKIKNYQAKNLMDIDIDLDEIHLKQITSVITDCDHEFILKKLTEIPKTVENRVQTVINNILETKSYPKLKDAIQKQNKKAKTESALSMNFDIDDFLRMIPNPIEFFYNQTRKSSENYKNHCRIYLKNKYKHITVDSIEKTFLSNNCNLIATLKQLEDAYYGREEKLLQRCSQQTAFLNDVNINPNIQIKFQRKKNSYYFQSQARTEQEYPDSLDDHFFKELWFIRNEKYVREYLNGKETSRQERLHKARLEKTLLECQCCFNDDYLPEDMLSCEVNHQFCKKCVKTYAETNIGDSKYTFSCFSDGCKSTFSLKTLKIALDPVVFDNLLKKIQDEEIKNANIPNLESCQHCNFAIIIDNPDEKVFYCQNQECLKETCRNCKEPNHLPLRCNEIEQKQEVDMRTWIENKVSEAMIRVCFKCGKRFYKEEGCNMMHCVCGASMCYICRKPIKDYSHFNNGCAQFSDNYEVHKKEMEEAYKKATEEYFQLHPDKKGIQLKHDPKKLIEQLNKPKNQRAPNQNINQNMNQQPVIFFPPLFPAMHQLQPQQQPQQRPLPLPLPQPQIQNQINHLFGNRFEPIVQQIPNLNQFYLNHPAHIDLNQQQNNIRTLEQNIINKFNNHQAR